MSWYLYLYLFLGIFYLHLFLGVCIYIHISIFIFWYLYFYLYLYEENSKLQEAVMGGLSRLFISCEWGITPCLSTDLETIFGSTWWVMIMMMMMLIINIMIMAMEIKSHHDEMNGLKCDLSPSRGARGPCTQCANSGLLRAHKHSRFGSYISFWCRCGSPEEGRGGGGRCRLDHQGN